MNNNNEKDILYRATPPIFWNQPITIIFYILLCFALIGIPLILWTRVVHKRKVLEIDNDEIHYSEGVLSKNIVDIPVGSVRTVRVNQSFLQRIVNIGNLEIYTSGDLPELVLRGYPDPHLIRDILK